MLRLETEKGWWLVTHPDHARLAGAFAERWGNDRFLAPEPRIKVLKGIARHDDGWGARDVKPQITRQGKPSAFSVELVGKYSAFEEIDLADYLAVRDKAVRLIAAEDPYAAVLISMHTYNLLTDHFRLLQAMDNLSLMTCVDFRQPSHLLHALPLRGGGRAEVKVRSVGVRHFVLEPYPFDESSVSFTFPARHVEGKLFGAAEELQAAFAAVPVEMLSVTLRAA